MDGQLSGRAHDGRRHTQGLRDEYLRICHLEQDLVIEDVAKLLDSLFRGDRRIGNDKKFSDKVVLVDENEMTAVMMGFPTLKCLSRETPSTYVSVLLNMELDHTDYFKNMKHIKDSFVAFTQNTRADGFVVLNADGVDAFTRRENQGQKGYVRTETVFATCAA